MPLLLRIAGRRGLMHVCVCARACVRVVLMKAMVEDAAARECWSNETLRFQIIDGSLWLDFLGREPSPGGWYPGELGEGAALILVLSNGRARDGLARSSAEQ
jgi:hypothetical protein